MFWCPSVNNPTFSPWKGTAGPWSPTAPAPLCSARFKISATEAITLELDQGAGGPRKAFPATTSTVTTGSPTVRRASGFIPNGARVDLLPLVER